MSDKSGTGNAGGRSGFKRFAVLVLVIFGILLLIVAALAIFGPDGGLLPFNYEGA